MPETNYELHKLGWRAFQDLCGVVLQEVLGQTFTTFADTNDIGQDGAYYGHWAAPTDTPIEEVADFVSTPMPVVVQCKFSANPSGTLKLSNLKAELEKIEKLHKRGQCDGYIVMTNLRVTGKTHADFIDEVRKRGPQTAKILHGDWLCTQIEKNWNLRRYVPRVYGLGDLTSILDDRRMRQARALLTSLTRELETFVPTDAYRRASDALTENGFVMLLGEPACGKSTIAAMLCMTALDNWQCDVMRVDSPQELITHWNPDYPRQMFWIDDAFGSIVHKPHLTDAWTRHMPQVMAAVSNGARVLMTSRDYIYRDAVPRLKEYAFPRLREQKVVIDVTALSTAEKEQMLYNHLKAGDQPAAVLDEWRPHLRAVAAAGRFQPEVARRLSSLYFMPTGGLASRADLVSYFEHPKDFLVEVLKELEPEQRAALAAVYLSGGELVAPFVPDERLSVAVTALGATIPQTARAFAAIEGTFLSRGVNAGGNYVWRFHHPTIREGFAAAVAANISTLAVYLEGMTTDELVSELDCGGSVQQGTLVQVPPSMYPLVVSRVPVPDRKELSVSPSAWFLRTRCSDEFLRMWAGLNANSLPGMADFGMMIDAMWEPGVLSRLNKAGALPDEVRVAAVERIVEYSIDDLDPAWADPDLENLFTPKEHADLFRRVKEEVLPNLEYRIDEYVRSIRGGLSADELYETPRDYVNALRIAFHGNRDILSRCEIVEQHINDRSSEDEGECDSSSESSRLAAPARPASGEVASARDPFEDVAAGH